MANLAICTQAEYASLIMTKTDTWNTAFMGRPPCNGQVTSQIWSTSRKDQTNNPKNDLLTTSR